MIKDRVPSLDKVTATVIGLNEKGLKELDKLKSQIKDPRDPVFIQRVKKLNDKYGYIKSVSVNHNIVTNEGDALIADLLAETPARQKLDNSNANITVGTGWTGSSPKTNEAVNTPAGGSPTKGMEATYPKLKGTWGNADDNVTQYRCIFTAGLLTGSPVIDEAGLGNNATEASGDNLAYAEISPTATIGASDTLQVDWELTFVGA